MSEVVLLVHNIRSTHNVGSIFRTAEGFGVSRVILSGYTPYPRLDADKRLPHIANKLHTQIHKTALGAEELVPFEYRETPPFQELKSAGFTVVGLEQDARSIYLNKFTSPTKIALLLGEEVEGLTDELRAACDVLVEIPMVGKKESFNVSVATGVALYGLMVAS